MEAELIIRCNRAVLEEAEQVLDCIGLDIQSAVKIFLKRLVKDQGISFLLSENVLTKPTEPRVEISNVNQYQIDKGGVTKSIAIRLFKSEGIELNRNITFASKNRGAHNYWANPEFGMLKNDWYIILNDWEKRELYLFLIPANSINTSQLTPRGDKEYLIDLQIMYNDNSFTDNRSGYSFVKHLIKQISY